MVNPNHLNPPKQTAPSMGRIKTKLIKRTGNQIVAENPEKFSKDFEANKKEISEIADIPSKKIRNVLAGYVTRLAKKQHKRR